MPRDIDPQLQNYERVQLLDIDKISKLDDENKHLRVERMQKIKYIIDKYIKLCSYWYIKSCKYLSATVCYYWWWRVCTGC